MVLQIIEEEPRIAAGYSIECSTLEGAYWKSKDEAIQVHLLFLKRSKPYQDMAQADIVHMSQPLKKVQREEEN